MRRNQALYLATILAIAIIGYLAPIPKVRSGMASAPLLSSSAESMKVSNLTSSSALNSSNVIIFNVTSEEISFSPSFYEKVEGILSKFSLNSSLDYNILNKEIEDRVSKTLLSYVKQYFPYLSYMKSLINQFDAISIYVVEQMSSLWNLKLLLENLDGFKREVYSELLNVSKAVNVFEEKFYQSEIEAYLKLNESEALLNERLEKARKIYDSIVKVNEVFRQIYSKFNRVLEMECSNGSLSIRKVSVIISESNSILERTFGNALSNAFLETAAAWPKDLSEICKDQRQRSSFVAQTLARFVSIAPDSLSKDVGELFGLNPEASKTIITIALSLGPRVKREVLDSAFVEALRLIYNVPANEAILLLGGIKGHTDAKVKLIIKYMNVTNGCVAAAIRESVTTDSPLSVSLSRCEMEGLLKVLNGIYSVDTLSLNVSLAYRGLESGWLDYFAKEAIYEKLRGFGVPHPIAFEIAFEGVKPNEYEVLYQTLNASGSLYAREIAFAVAHSKDFEQAKKIALVNVFKCYLRELEANGLSQKAAELLLSYLLAWTPGLNDELVNQIVFKVVVTELVERSSSFALSQLVFKLIDVNKFIKELIQCPDMECALEKTNELSSELASKFISKYTAYKLLVGKDEKHPIFLISSPLKYEEVSKIKCVLSNLSGVREVYFTGMDLLNEDVQLHVNESLNDVNLFSTVAVLLVLLLSTRSLKLTFIPLIIILIVLKIYDLVLFALSRATGFVPSTIDLIVATATVLGVGIDYTLYATSKSREVDLREAMKPILLASGVASTGFLLFGALATVFLPSLSSIGVSVPLAIMLTSTLGPLMASSIADVLNVEPMPMPRKKPGLAALSVEFPRLTVALALALALIGVLTLKYWPPGYDLFLFLPPDAPSVKSLSVLEEYSSPGVIGQTVILLKLRNSSSIAEVTEQIDNLVQYFLESGYFDYAFTVTRPLGKFVSYDYKALKLLGADRFVKGSYVVIYLLPHYPPDSNIMIDYVGYMRSFLKKWINSKSQFFEEALVGGESAINYDVSNAINNVILSYMTPLMIILSSAIFVVVFERMEFILATAISTLVPIAVSLGLSNVLFRTLFSIPMLWLVVPLLVTAILSIGSDYLVFYLYGVKEGMEKCKVRLDGECVNMLNVLLYTSSKLSKLIMGFALTFSVAYLSMIASKIWALREIGASIGLAAILLLISVAYTLVPAVLALVYRRR